MKKILLISLTILTAVLIFNCSGKKTKQTSLKYEGFNSHQVVGMDFFWKVSGGNLEIILHAPTEGWIAVGFDPSTMMQDANFIIAYVKEGRAYIRDDYGTWMTTHEDDTAIGGTNNITIIDSDEKDGSSKIHFSIPMDSQDSKDKVLEQGKTYKVIFAYGASDDFTSMHRKRGSADITF